MAISGTGGIDGLADAYERLERERMKTEELEREADDILHWFSSFGFQGWGRLCGDESLVENGGKHQNLTRRKRREDIERASVLESQVPSSRQGEDLKQSFDTEKIVFSGNGDGDADEEAESLPPSPMLELVLGSPCKDEVIPMGFNLGHDLGDFLRWETDHVQTLFVDK